MSYTLWSGGGLLEPPQWSVFRVSDTSWSPGRLLFEHPQNATVGNKVEERARNEIKRKERKEGKEKMGEKKRRGKRRM